jgi:hypothetical protein
LRREDIAELLDVSPLWYALFDSGASGRRFSSSFLERVQAILCGSRADRAKFIELAVTSGHASPEIEARWHRSRWQSVVSDVADTLAKIKGASSLAIAVEPARTSLRAPPT